MFGVPRKLRLLRDLVGFLNALVDDLDNKDWETEAVELAMQDVYSFLIARRLRPFAKYGS